MCQSCASGIEKSLAKMCSTFKRCPVHLGYGTPCSKKLLITGLLHGMSPPSTPHGTWFLLRDTTSSESLSARKLVLPVCSLVNPWSTRAVLSTPGSLSSSSLSFLSQPAWAAITSTTGRGLNQQKFISSSFQRQR